MNCSVISVNILAPLESRIFSISLTCGRTEEETGRTVTQTPAPGGNWHDLDRKHNLYGTVEYIDSF